MAAQPALLPGGPSWGSAWRRLPGSPRRNRMPRPKPMTLWRRRCLPESAKWSSPPTSAQPEDMAAPEDLDRRPTVSRKPTVRPRRGRGTSRSDSSNRFGNPSRSQNDDRRSRGRRSSRSRSDQPGGSGSASDYSRGGDRTQSNASAGTNGGLARLDYSAFKIIVDRNIFDPNRYPHRPGEPRVRPAPKSGRFADAGRHHELMRRARSPSLTGAVPSTRRR